MCPSEAAEGLRDGLVCKREVSGRTWNLQEKTLQNDLFIRHLIFFILLPQTCVSPRRMGMLLAVVAVIVVMVEFGISGPVRSVLCCSREKTRARGPDNTKNQVSVMQVTPGTLREIVVPLNV